MRLVGELEELAHARTFSDYLIHLGIENQIIEEPSDDKIIYEIWVHEEDKVEQSEELLRKFLENPDDEEYQGVSKIAGKIKREAKREAKERPQYMDARTTIFYRGATRNGTLTLILIAACIIVAVLSKLGKDIMPIRMLFVSEFIVLPPSLGRGLPEIWNGEIWRMFTPMLIHFGPYHLFFDLWCLWFLGNMMEDRKGTLFLAIFILIISGSSNLAQYLASGPLFGGMSGVIFGLLGYIWMKGKYDPASRLALHRLTVIMMIGWYFLCLVGIMPNIANMAHTVGLVVGIAWGYLTSPHFKQQLRKLKE
jgi:GlpG protein